MSDEQKGQASELVDPHALDLPGLTSQIMLNAIRDNLVPELKASCQQAVKNMANTLLNKYGGPLYEQAENALKQALKIEFDPERIQAYNQLISKAYEDELQKYVSSEIACHISEKVFADFKAADVPEIHMQDIIDRVKANAVEDSLIEEDAKITFIIKRYSSGLLSDRLFLYFDPSEAEDWHSCRYKITIDTSNENRVSQVSSAGKYMHDMLSFERFLYALQINNTKVILPDDFEDLDLYLETEDW